MNIIDPQPEKKLYRSRDKMIGGVCGGLAKYFNADIVLIRIIALILLFAGSAGFWVYIVLWMITPLDPERR